MVEVLIAADDLTGGNACAAGFAHAGLRAVTTSFFEATHSLPDFGDRFDAIVITTDSRHSTPEDAALVTREAIRAGWPARLVSCRIDTTLRGNVGAAAAAAIGEVRTLSGERTVGLCVPAFPSANRVTVEGRQLLEGRRLEDTELSRDVRTPVRTSLVEEVLSDQTGMKTALIPLHVVAGPKVGLVAEFRRLLEIQDLDAIVADSLVPAHIEAVAEAAVEAGDGIRWVGIDPGPATLALAQAMGFKGSKIQGRVIAVSGSASDLTQLQLGRLIAERNPVVVRPVFKPGDNLPDIELSAQAMIEAVRSAGPRQAVLYAQVLVPSDRRTLTDEEVERLPEILGSIVTKTLEETAVDGVYSTGGDITAAILSKLGSYGVEIHGEVIPLAVEGEVIGGPWAGLSIVTKGGLIGGPDAAILCVDKLTQTANQRSKWVRAAPLVESD
ncbi:four-carbon acid sugar kinase family protein [Actinomyces minihominis]|uniref:four-carbon acid sugar kinase family protein n=1 Tax=Actinomyces minihominis TaxID=2002838 RepID=UPI000C08B853|nr:four-carbon acid sugar kinase family protein [Actinomyces minihominis]